VDKSERVNGTLSDRNDTHILGQYFLIKHDELSPQQAAGNSNLKIPLRATMQNKHSVGIF
jgi:hypothetical protein